MTSLLALPNVPCKPYPVYFSLCFMRLLNLQLDLLLYQMSDPKKSHSAWPGLRSYSVYWVIVLRDLLWKFHVTVALHDQADYTGVDKITGTNILQYGSRIWLTTLPYNNNTTTCVKLLMFSICWNYIRGLFLYWKGFLILHGDPGSLSTVCCQK